MRTTKECQSRSKVDHIKNSSVLSESLLRNENKKHLTVAPDFCKKNSAVSTPNIT